MLVAQVAALASERTHRSRHQGTSSSIDFACRQALSASIGSIAEPLEAFVATDRPHLSCSVAHCTLISDHFEQFIRADSVDNMAKSFGARLCETSAKWGPNHFDKSCNAKVLLELSHYTLTGRKRLNRFCKLESIKK